MRLVDKFTIWFLLITAFVLLTGGVIVFSRVQHEVDREAIRRIKSHIDEIAAQLEKSTPVAELESEYVQIVEIDPNVPPIGLQIYDTMAVYRPNMRALDRKLTVESSYRIGSKHYKVSMYDFVAEPDEIADGVRESLLWIFLILFSALNAIEKLSKINHSLTLLNKLGNQEFATLEPVNMSAHLQAILDDLAELIEMKSISLRKEIAENVKILLHPSLADILISNLCSNAIRHNVHDGHIYISLTPRRLMVANSGKQPEVPVEQLFERFTRTSPNDDSVGLGLAIVKQICDVSGLSISYEYKTNEHIVTVTFPAA